MEPWNSIMSVLLTLALAYCLMLLFGTFFTFGVRRIVRDRLSIHCLIELFDFTDTVCLRVERPTYFELTLPGLSFIAYDNRAFCLH